MKLQDLSCVAAGALATFAVACTTPEKAATVPVATGNTLVGSTVAGAAEAGGPVSDVSAPGAGDAVIHVSRSEERRVGKECRSRGSPYQ